MDKKILTKNFSRCASSYDKYADIQQLAASELIQDLPPVDYQSIFEIGCGTGNYTRLLRERFKSAAIKAVDISEAMVSLARRKLRYGGIEFTAEDAEEIKANAEYDLITSSAAIQWFDFPDRSIRRYQKALREGGMLAFSVFGPLTFKELGNVLRKVSAKRDFSISSRSFLDKDTLERMLARSLRKVSVKEIFMSEEHPTLAELLKKIKYTGVRGSAPKSPFTWSRNFLKNAEDAYRKEYSRIIATYQIFLCKAQKR